MQIFKDFENFTGSLLETSSKTPFFTIRLTIGWPNSHKSKSQIVRPSPPRRSPPQMFTTPCVKSDVHHPRRSTHLTFTKHCVLYISCQQLGDVYQLVNILILDIFCKQLGGMYNLLGVCGPFRPWVGNVCQLDICISIVYIIPTIGECMSVGEYIDIGYILPTIRGVCRNWWVSVGPSGPGWEMFVSRIYVLVLYISCQQLGGYMSIGEYINIGYILPTIGGRV